MDWNAATRHLGPVPFTQLAVAHRHSRQRPEGKDTNSPGVMALWVAILNHPFSVPEFTKAQSSMELYHQERSRYPCSVKRSKVASGPGCLNQWLLPLPPDQGHQDWGSLQVPLWYVPWCRPYHGTPPDPGHQSLRTQVPRPASLVLCLDRRSRAARFFSAVLCTWCTQYVLPKLPARFFFYPRPAAAARRTKPGKTWGASVQPMSVFSRSLFSWCKIYPPLPRKQTDVNSFSLSSSCHPSHLLQKYQTQACGSDPLTSPGFLTVLDVVCSWVPMRTPMPASASCQPCLH